MGAKDSTIEKALALYREGRLTAREAKRLSGLTMAEWADLCTAEGLPWYEIEYSPEELREEVEATRRRRQRSEMKA